MTGDYIVTYSRVMDDDAVFKALADPTRRKLLDKLYTTGGLTQGQLEEGLEMTRFEWPSICASSKKQTL